MTPASPKPAASLERLAGQFRRHGTVSEGARFAWRIVFLTTLVAIAILGHVIDREGLRDNADGHVSILDIIYFTVITVTTVGYGDITPVSDGARMFDTFVVTPIRIFVWLIFLGTAYDFVLRHSWERWRMGRMQRALSGHTIICGYGTTGTEAAAELLRDGTAASDIVVIDLDHERLAIAEARGMGTVMGDATHNTVLQAAAVERAGAIIICPSRDDSAILMCLTAKRLAPQATRIVSIRAVDNEVLAQDAAADVIINPVNFAGRMLAGALRGRHVTEYLEDLITARGRVKLRERVAQRHEIGISLVEVKPGVGLRLYRDDKIYTRWSAEAEKIQLGDTIIEIVQV